MLESEVTVIGGGVIGTSIAYYLSREKREVVLLEKDHLASEASGACDGFIALQTKRSGPYLDLALKSAEMFDKLTEELGTTIEHRKEGGMIVIEEGSQLDLMEKFVHSQRQAGLDVDMLGCEEAQKLEPALSNHIAGATYCPHDSLVNPMLLTFAFALAAKRRGARICTGTEVLSIKTERNRIKSVVTNVFELKTKTVVNAAGVFAPSIGAMVGISVPIKPRRGQIVVTEPSPRFINRGLNDAKYLLAKLYPDLIGGSEDELDRLTGGLAVEQTDPGNILLGSTREFVGYDKSITIEGITAIVRRSTRIIPRLKQLCAIRAFAGLRPYTPDGLPIVDSLDSPEGFVIASGHEGDGIALSPITGKTVAELIIDGKPDPMLRTFALNRFKEGHYSTAVNTASK